MAGTPYWISVWVQAQPLVKRLRAASVYLSKVHRHYSGKALKIIVRYPIKPPNVVTF